MTLREAVIKEIEGLSEEALEGVLEYIKCMKEPPEDDAKEEGLALIVQGEGDYASGDFVAWEE
jgi:hypothetical protein